VSERTAALRRAFDESFARAPASRADGGERILRLRIGGDRYAVKLAEVAGFAAARKIVPLSSAITGALGLAGLRGALVPVYSLAALLGRVADDEPPRWFLLANAPEPVALAFARFDGYAEVAPDELLRHNVVAIPPLIETIAARVSDAAKER
jgi:purine-binding chemotaxis protein CheW